VLVTEEALEADVDVFDELDDPQPSATMTDAHAAIDAKLRAHGMGTA
jgi:hypothetical protein